jgi:hypothetical protein
MPDPKRQQTIGPSFEIEQNAKNLFTRFLPPRWLRREDSPDVHIDYRVEVVTDGEPTGAAIRVQVKGRTLSLGKKDRFKAKFETKHLLYYLQCREPVFIFLIDPTAEVGRWVFVQRYLKSVITEEALRKRQTYVITFDRHSSMDDRAAFEKEVQLALTYVRDMFPGSPLAAIHDKKRTLEKQHPDYSIDIQASPENIKFRVQSRDAAKSGIMRLVSSFDKEKVQKFVEQGDSFQIRSSDLDSATASIFTQLLSEFGVEQITIKSATLDGNVQIHFKGEAHPIFLQADGAWTLGSKRFSFEGQLPNSPLRVVLRREIIGPGVLDPNSPIKMRLDWESWRGEPLLTLPHFTDIRFFLHCESYSVRCLAKGNDTGQVQMSSVKTQGHQDAMKAIEWIHRCRSVASFLGVNPIFPFGKGIEVWPTDDPEVLVELVEKGFHEQPHTGLILVVESDRSEKLAEILHRPGMNLQQAGQFLKFDFYGTSVLFGPLTYSLTDAELIDIEELANQRVALHFKGGFVSKWSLTYQRPPIK